MLSPPRRNSVLERLEKSGVQGDCGPKLNPKQTADYWYRQGREGRHHRAAAQAREREAQGRDDRLRHADQVVAGDAAQAVDIMPTARRLGQRLEAARRWGMRHGADRNDQG